MISIAIAFIFLLDIVFKVNYFLAIGFKATIFLAILYRDSKFSNISLQCSIPSAMSYGLDKSHLDRINLKLNVWKDRQKWDSNSATTEQIENILHECNQDYHQSPRNINKSAHFQIGSYDDSDFEAEFDEYSDQNDLANSKSNRPRVRDPRATDIPTIGELKQMVPLIFANHKSLSEYFNQELFFAANLKTLPENFNKLTYKPGSINDLNELLTTINHMMQMINGNFETLTKSFDSIKHSMNLQIFSNVKHYNQLNNARTMVNGLVNIKMIFQTFIQLLYDLDNYILDINEKIDDWNSSSPVNDNDSYATNDIYGDFNSSSRPSGLNNVIYIINNHLSTLSNQEFDDFINQSILIFKEFVETYFKSHQSDEDFFSYEIVLFDDHLKSVLDLF